MDAFRFAPRGPGFRGGGFPGHARRIGEAQKKVPLRREQGLRPPEIHVRERNPFQQPLNGDDIKGTGDVDGERIALHSVSLYGADGFHGGVLIGNGERGEPAFESGCVAFAGLGPDFQPARRPLFLHVGKTACAQQYADSLMPGASPHGIFGKERTVGTAPGAPLRRPEVRAVEMSAVPALFPDQRCGQPVHGAFGRERRFSGCCDGVRTAQGAEVKRGLQG